MAKITGFIIAILLFAVPCFAGEYRITIQNTYDETAVANIQCLDHPEFPDIRFSVMGAELKSGDSFEGHYKYESFRSFCVLWLRPMGKRLNEFYFEVPEWASLVTVLGDGVEIQ